MRAAANQPESLSAHGCSISRLPAEDAGGAEHVIAVHPAQVADMALVAADPSSVVLKLEDEHKVSWTSRRLHALVFVCMRTRAAAPGALPWALWQH